MNDYYVYIHIGLKSGAVFYVGKGRTIRATSKTKRSLKWKEKVKEEGGYSVKLIHENLNESEAMRLEENLVFNQPKDWCLINRKQISSKIPLDFNHLSENFYYDPESPSGLRWKRQVVRGKSGKIVVKNIGDMVGSLSVEGYWHVGLGGKLYRAHRVVYLLLNGSIKETDSIDHLDFNRQNNKIENLVCTTNSLNSRRTDKTNLRKINSTGYNRISKRERIKGTLYMVRWRDWLSGKEFTRRFDDLLLAIEFEKSLPT
jgi:hypothetical protein